MCLKDENAYIVANCSKKLFKKNYKTERTKPLAQLPQVRYSLCCVILPTRPL